MTWEEQGFDMCFNTNVKQSLCDDSLYIETHKEEPNDKYGHNSRGFYFQHACQKLPADSAAVLADISALWNLNKTNRGRTAEHHSDNRVLGFNPQPQHISVCADPNTNQQKGTQCCGGWTHHAGVRRFGRHERILAGLLEFGFKWVEGFFFSLSTDTQFDVCLTLGWDRSHFQF